jgi:hypothetical protein
MAKARKPPAAQNWAACKRNLQTWPRAGVIALVQELYRLSDDNRRFLHARLLPDRTVESREAAAKLIGRMVAPQAIFNGRFRHADVKRIVDQFQRATDDPAAVAELLLADLSESLSSFAQVGDFEPIVDHIYATMVRLEKCLAKLDATVSPALVQRLDELARRWGSEFGYGVSDQLVAMAHEWRTRLENP